MAKHLGCAGPTSAKDERRWFGLTCQSPLMGWYKTLLDVVSAGTSFIRYSPCELLIPADIIAFDHRLFMPLVSTTFDASPLPPKGKDGNNWITTTERE